MSFRIERPLPLWLAAGWIAASLLPWYAAPDLGWTQIALGLWSDPAAASGLAQALAFGHGWLLLAPASLIVATLALRIRPARTQGTVVLAAAGIGLLLLALQALAITPKGLDPRLAGWLPASAQGQGALGAGGSLTFACLLVIAGIGWARRGGFRGDAFVASAVLGCAALLAVFIAWPVLKTLSAAFLLEDGALSAAAFWSRFANERIWGLACLAGGGQCGVAWNTLALAAMTAAASTLVGTLLALLSERGGRALRRPLGIVALLPMIAPPFVVGLGLILLFGRAGIVTEGLARLFDVEPTRWFYGFFGVWLAQMFAFTPIAFLIMRGVVQGVSPTLEEAALMLRADPRRAFWTVTLPLLKPGLANAFLVGFVESVADFGNPIVVGGRFSLLSTDVFFAIVGAQYDQGRAAALAWVLMLLALGAFAAQRAVLGKRSFTTVTGKGDSGLGLPLPAGVQRAANLIGLPWLAFTLVIYVFAFTGGLVRIWGRDYTPTLQHYVTAFSVEWNDFGLAWTGTAWHSLANTVELAGIAAPATAALGLLMAWLLARVKFRGAFAFEFMTLLAFAIPGTVLGVSYVMAFNTAPLDLTGTGLVIVLCFVFRNLPLGVRAGTAAFKQLDRSLDEASLMLRASSFDTFRHIVIPLMKPAFVASLVYSFVRGVTTVSAVIFLVTAETELATTYIIGRVGQSDYGVALAYCTVLMALMCVATGLIQWLVGERRLGRRQAQRAKPEPVVSPRIAT